MRARDAKQLLLGSIRTKPLDRGPVLLLPLRRLLLLGLLLRLSLLVLQRPHQAYPLHDLLHLRLLLGLPLPPGGNETGKPWNIGNYVIEGWHVFPYGGDSTPLPRKALSSRSKVICCWGGLNAWSTP